MSHRVRAMASIATVFVTALGAAAQQPTPPPGSPTATKTIGGQQLPPPPQPFGGKIERNAAQSTPFWPARVVPPKGAPNVLLVMIDDEGFGAPSTFGGVIPTPTLDRIAAMGLRYTQFHSTSLCSPTRAAIITGRNHHSMGFGVISEQSTGYPGYNSIMTRDKATIGRILKDNGYWTSWFGKDHNTPEFQASQAGPFDQWPTGMGFDYFYGFVGGDANQWQPNLFRNTSAIYPYQGHPGWNLMTAMADDAIEYLHRVTAINTEQPFFIYYVPGSTHAPHHPTPEWIKKASDLHLFDKGWNALRDTIFANQKRLGVIPADAKLTPWPDTLLKKWETLSPDEKKLFIRQADVYAAYLMYADNEIGRVVKAIEDAGKLDNTLIMFISGDNGASAEGTTDRHAERGRVAQRGRDSGRGAAQVLRRVGQRPHVSPLRRWLGMGVRHAVLVDKADRVSLRRNAAGAGDRVAQGHQGSGRHSQPVPPCDRHRPDDSRGDGHQGTGRRRRHSAEADRRGEHDVHLRQGQCERGLDASHPVLRDDG